MNEEQTTGDALKSAAGFSIGLAVLMIVVGFVAIAMPTYAGLGISLIVGWLMVFGGVLYIAYAFAAKGFGGFVWRLLIGLLYAFGGFYVIANPDIALQSLTLLVAVILIAEGVLQSIGYFQVRGLSGSGWILFDGIAALLLGVLIIYPWPGSSSWAIGTLFGVNLVISGFTRLMYSMTVRKIVAAATP